MAAKASHEEPHLTGSKGSVLYLCYYDVTEPLVQTQVVAYLEGLAALGFSLHLLTFERRRLGARTVQQIRKRLARAGIHWHSLHYHQRPVVPAKTLDLLAGLVKTVGICWRFKIGLVHARSHVAAVMAWLNRFLLGRRFLFDVRGLLADEYAETGNWQPGGLLFALVKWCESRLFYRANALVFLTDAIKTDLCARHPDLTTPIQVIPCCVDTERFRSAAADRMALRQSRAWTDRLVLVYVGKLGSWYLPAEMARFFAVALKLYPHWFFQVLTQSDPGIMHRAMTAAGVARASYQVGVAAPVELPGLVAAADAGISFITPTYAKKASSPTKLGEYLAAGLPVVVNSGIGDCDAMIGPNRLGVIVERFAEQEYARAANELNALCRDGTTGTRCRQFAQTDLSLTNVGVPRYAEVYRRLLAHES